MNLDKILVVDDERLVFESIQDTLTDYQLFHAENGEVGLQMFAQHQPILIILDLRMPVMDGFAFLRRLGVCPEAPYAVIILSGHAAGVDIQACYDMGITAFLRKPFNVFELKGVVSQCIAAKRNTRALERRQDRLEELVQQRTEQLSKEIAALERTEIDLRKAMHNLLTIRVAPGVFWMQVPEVGIYVLCGCPSEVVKHLMRQGLINTIDKNGVICETGPNVILLSDLLVQNGGFANLAEFPVLQMLYRQGMILPGHPNNTGVKPMLIGSPEQVRAQMEYIHRGKHGLVSKAELMACGIDADTAENMMRVKLKFARSIQPPSQLLDVLEVNAEAQLIRHGVTVCRVGFNRYQFAFRGDSTEVDLNLPPNVFYEPPYPLGYHHFARHYFAVLHAGEGDGWDENRPSMGSMIMFQGRIYLVDAGPGILQSMTALGIDISEVEGIFHTHGHDDHFAGLPALIHSDHRLKYYATPMVRSAVVKKFSALMSLTEDKFAQFFEICDLTFDVWNNCDGLEVMPFYSPHPTETNILLFRALDVNKYRTYAHWADLSSFAVMESMVGDGPLDVPQAFIGKVQRDYLRAADLKKLDVGGGHIHGVAEDFRMDPSDRLILAHVDRKFTIEEMEIGSESSFGALDVLIAGNQDYLYQRAFSCLKTFFPQVAEAQLRMLLNCPILEYNAGTIIHRSGENADYVVMILAGTVAYLESTAEVCNHLAFGSLIGGSAFFSNHEPLKGTYRAFSHCSVLRFSTVLFRTFLTNNNLLPRMEAVMDKISFLRTTWLFGEQTTFSSLRNVAKMMTLHAFAADVDIPQQPEPTLWLVVRGEVQLCDGEGCVLEVVKAGGFFGEHTCFASLIISWRFKTASPADIYGLSVGNLLDIPIVHWKILEVLDKRKKLAPFS